MHDSMQLMTDPTIGRTPRLLIVMEGGYDISFLKRISRVLHRTLQEVPDLGMLEANREVILLSLQGKVTLETTQHFAALEIPEFHLYARKARAERLRREAIVEALQQRPACTALLTWKYGFENYLHPDLVYTNRGANIWFNGNSDVPHVLARRFINGRGRLSWGRMTDEGRRRALHDARKWLCTQAVLDMTLDLLQIRDPYYEVLDWFVTINSILDSTNLAPSGAEGVA